MTNEVITRKLDEELRERNTKLFIPHIVVILLTMYALRFLNVYYPYILILSSLIFRYLILHKRPQWKFLYLLMVSLTGIGWGLIFYFSNASYGLFTVETLFVLGVIITTMSGGITAFSASRITAATFLVSISIIPITTLLLSDQTNYYLLGILFFINLGYQFYHVQVANTYIRESVIENQNLQEFLDAIPGHVAIIDESGIFTMVNNELNNFFAKIIGENVRTFLPESTVCKALIEFMDSDQDYAVQEVLVEKEGNVNWYMVTMRKLKKSGKGIVASILPITELVKAKNDLKIQEARSQYASKLASLGEMSAGIAHEVNNPLTIIEGAASLMKVMLKEPELDMPGLENATSRILSTSQRIAKIIRSLRTLAGDAEEEPFRNVTFQSIIEPCLEISRTRFDLHKIKLEVIHSDEDVELFGNEVQLSQVMMNLVSNAIDAVKDHDGSRWIRLEYRPSLEWLDIRVIDSGPGISPENRKKIMEPFFTTKEVDQGTGLGLSISKSIVENHEGELSLEPESSHTAFRIRFPRMNAWKGPKRNGLGAKTLAAQK